MTDPDHVVRLRERLSAQSGVAYVDDDLRALLAERDRLREAVKPLADCEIIGCDTPLPDSDSARYFIRMGEIRAARAALSMERDDG